MPTCKIKLLAFTQPEPWWPTPPATWSLAAAFSRSRSSRTNAQQETGGVQRETRTRRRARARARSRAHSRTGCRHHSDGTGDARCKCPVSSEGQVDAVDALTCTRTRTGERHVQSERCRAPARRGGCCAGLGDTDSRVRVSSRSPGECAGAHMPTALCTRMRVFGPACVRKRDRVCMCACTRAQADGHAGVARPGIPTHTRSGGFLHRPRARVAGLAPWRALMWGAAQKRRQMKRVETKTEFTPRLARACGKTR